LFPDGFRVAHAQAIENIDFYETNSLEQKKVLKIYFGKSLIYPTYEQALIQAAKIAEDYYILEYGIAYIGEYPGFI